MIASQKDATSKDAAPTSHAAKRAGVVRCAIYTRKSSEEGLEQEFNSLDAQRESAEAYIASQKGAGWTCLPGHYDDGGYTGGNMERPGLKRLLEDIEAGMIDCVVVYKVDRLSRSLIDFARMLQVFEGRGVSFVSVTQQFNTTQSMGRLTLNILLSFAQFEREIISERTRDKIAAARRKGKWAGGRPLLGYDIVTGPGGSRLVANEAEAAIVREVFAIYLKEHSLLKVVAACAKHGWTTKSWTTKAGKAQGGRPLDKGAVFALLTNVAYAGKVRHKREVYEGEHEAIVDGETFGKIQTRLRVNGSTGGSEQRNIHNALLKGLVRCASCGCSMTHTYTKSKPTRSTTTGASKGRRLYRYYVCSRAQKYGMGTCPAPSLPAGDLEAFVVEQIKGVVTGSGSMAEAVVDRALAMIRAARPDLAIDRDEVMGSLEVFDPVWESMTPKERITLVHALVERVDWDASTERVTVTYREVEPVQANEDGVLVA